MDKGACAHQFTGGRDSTLATLMLVEKYGFREIHLLTFKTELTADLDKVNKNIEKLRIHFKNRAIIHHQIIETHDLLRTLVQSQYVKNLISYGTYNIATFCPSCRLSHHAHTIVYCLQNNISTAADGVNELTGFDLFQQQWAVQKMEELYKHFGISYCTPLLNSQVSSEQVLEDYNKANDLTNPFYESQPRCLGGGQFHNLYLRCYYLPVKGKAAYQTTSLNWIEDKMTIAIDHINNHILKDCGAKK